MVVWAARPLIVVEDTARRTLLWIPHGTVRRVPITSPTRPDPGDVHARTMASLQHRDWLLGEHVWDVSSLWIVRPDDWYTILVSWRPTGVTSAGTSTCRNRCAGPRSGSKRWT